MSTFFQVSGMLAWLAIAAIVAVLVFLNALGRRPVKARLNQPK